MISAVSLEVGIFVPALVVLLDEGLVRRPAVAGGEGKVIVGVAAADDAFGMVLANGMGRNAKSNRAGELAVVIHAVAQRLLVEGHIIATPHRREDEIGVGRYRLCD